MNRPMIPALVVLLVTPLALHAARPAAPPEIRGGSIEEMVHTQNWLNREIEHLRLEAEPLGEFLLMLENSGFGKNRILAADTVLYGELVTIELRGATLGEALDAMLGPLRLTWGVRADGSILVDRLREATPGEESRTASSRKPGSGFSWGAEDLKPFEARRVAGAKAQLQSMADALRHRPEAARDTLSYTDDHGRFAWHLVQQASSLDWAQPPRVDLTGIAPPTEAGYRAFAEWAAAEEAKRREREEIARRELEQRQREEELRIQARLAEEQQRGNALTAEQIRQQERATEATLAAARAQEKAAEELRLIRWQMNRRPQVIPAPTDIENWGGQLELNRQRLNDAQRSLPGEATP